MRIGRLFAVSMLSVTVLAVVLGAGVLVPQYRTFASKSEAIKKYATSRGALFAPSSEEAAQKAVFPAVQANAWMLFESGKTKVSPDTVGIPKP